MQLSDIDSLKNELKEIKNSKIQTENIDKYLFDDQIPKKMKAYNLNCSILFVDIRNSTGMTEENGRKDMIKIYKMFAKLVVKVVEIHGGRVGQIMGDGMLCIFIGDRNHTSGEQAVNAAIDINTCLKKAYNPIVENEWKIDCGIGIRTGHIYLTRIGTRGKNKTCKVAYPSLITNYACKLCGESSKGEILLDDVTFQQIRKKDLKDGAKLVDKSNLKKCKDMIEKVWSIKYE